MKVYIIDNYDSFTYNLAHLIKQQGVKVTVVRNDKFNLDDLMDADKIILSPGPGIPDEAGQTLQVIDRYKGVKPILGVCLGHQAIGQYFGGKLTNLSQVYHGIQSTVSVDTTDYLFKGMDSTQLVGRYHSWVVDDNGFPSTLEVTSRSEEGQIMALRHRNYDICGIQFHPESVLTPEGQNIIKNWLDN